MSIYCGSTEVQDIYCGSTPVQEVYDGADVSSPIWVKFRGDPTFSSIEGSLSEWNTSDLETKGWIVYGGIETLNNTSVDWTRPPDGGAYIDFTPGNSGIKAGDTITMEAGFTTNSFRHRLRIDALGGPQRRFQSTTNDTVSPMDTDGLYSNIPYTITAEDINTYGGLRCWTYTGEPGSGVVTLTYIRFYYTSV